MSNKIAFILMNYGGPQNLDEVKPYLINIFKDPAILRAPFFIRMWLAYKIAHKRAQKSKNIFEKMGGKSPINDETMKQLSAIEQAILSHQSADHFKGFMIQRYSAPFAKDVMPDIIRYNPDKIILLPMYPQFSTTTTESSLKDFIRHAPKSYKNKIETIHYFYTDKGWQDYFIHQITPHLSKTDEQYTILYAAHSIPKSYVDAGDIYQEQVKESLSLIHQQVEEKVGKKINHHLAWQSKVGKMRWLEPSLEHSIQKLKPSHLIVVPLSFVAENSETLVELDMDMKDLAIENGNKSYIRISTPDTDPNFIQDLSQRIISLAEK